MSVPEGVVEMALSCALDTAGAIAGALPRARIMVLHDQPSVGDYLAAVPVVQCTQHRTARH